MHDHVLADFDLGEEGEADLLLDAAKLNATHRHVEALAGYLQDLSGNPKAHGVTP
jgi:hypothetical protein